MSRVFISYGRADADILADRLVTVLERAGHDVWIDRHELKGGRRWEEEVEAAIAVSDVVVALLTPHAVRRPDGVCLDELSMARYTGRRIIPIMVLPCRPPLGIYRLDWIDFRHWQIEASFDRAFARLTQSIDQPTDAVEGGYATLFSQLHPMDFGQEVSRLTRQFVGRQWLFDQIDEWLTRDDNRLFLVTGDPGIGKSALMAALIHRHPSVRAYHFCVADLADSLDPSRFVKSLAAQLATQLVSYRSAVEAIAPDMTREADPGSLFRRLVADPLRVETLNDPLIIVVDALDESLGYVGRNIARVIAERLDDLPPAVRVVVSSRQNADVLDLFSAYSPRPIDGMGEHNLRDAESFVRSRLNKPTLVNVVRRVEMPVEVVANAILAKCAGNFLYIRHALEALRVGLIDPRLPDAFPDGLIGIYQSFFRRVFSDSEDYGTVRPLLDVIVASREPLKAAQIGAFVNLDPFDVEQALQRLSDFFPPRDGRYQAFHKSISDWLTGTVGQSRQFRVNAQNGHRLIAKQTCLEYRTKCRDHVGFRRYPWTIPPPLRWSVDGGTASNGRSTVHSAAHRPATGDLSQSLVSAKRTRYRWTNRPISGCAWPYRMGEHSSVAR